MFIVLLYLLILSHYNIAVNNYFKRSLSALFLLCLYSDSLKVSLFVYNSMICKSHIIMYCLVEYKVDIFCNFRCWIHLFWKFIYSKKEKWIDFWHTLLPKWAEIIHVHFLSVGLSRGQATISKTQKKIEVDRIDIFLLIVWSRGASANFLFKKLKQKKDTLCVCVLLRNKLSIEFKC